MYVYVCVYAYIYVYICIIRMYYVYKAPPCVFMKNKAQWDVSRDKYSTKQSQASAVFISRHILECFIFHDDKLGGALESTYKHCNYHTWDVLYRIFKRSTASSIC